MTNVDEFGRLALIYTWRIENFSRCLLKKGERLKSPTVSVKIVNHNWFYLEVYPKGTKDEDEVTVLFRGYCGESSSVTLDLEFSVLKTDGKPSLSKKLKAKAFLIDVPNTYEWSNVFKYEALSTRIQELLPNDTLTLCCRIWRSAEFSPELGYCIARTRTIATRSVFFWRFKNFDSKSEEKFDTLIICNYSVGFLRVTINKNAVKIQVILKSIKMSHLTECRIEILDSKGNVVELVIDEHAFEVAAGSEQVWNLPEINNFKDIIENIGLCLPNDELSLRCEVVVFNESPINGIELILCTPKNENMTSDSLLPSSAYNLSHVITANKTNGASNALKDDLTNMYMGRKFSDFTLRSGENRFPVHKNILSARSSVFEAMLDNDMKESQMGEVDVSDLDSDTVNRMLLFVYTETVEELDWESASKLYYAADKYAIQPLKETCSSFLKSNLTTSSACEALFLADLHQDEDLKSAVEQFFVSHGKEILETEEWTQFEADHLKLAVAITKKMFLYKN